MSRCKFISPLECEAKEACDFSLLFKKEKPNASLIQLFIEMGLSNWIWRRLICCIFTYKDK